MSPIMAKNKIEIPGFPRVSGDEPPALIWLSRLEAFSPRERG